MASTPVSTWTVLATTQFLLDGCRNKHQGNNDGTTPYYVQVLGCSNARMICRILDRCSNEIENCAPPSAVAAVVNGMKAQHNEVVVQEKA
jgi:hypothetical protein